MRQCKKEWVWYLVAATDIGFGFGVLFVYVKAGEDVVRQKREREHHKKNEPYTESVCVCVWKTVQHSSRNQQYALANSHNIFAWMHCTFGLMPFVIYIHPMCNALEHPYRRFVHPFKYICVCIARRSPTHAHIMHKKKSKIVKIMFFMWNKYDYEYFELFFYMMRTAKLYCWSTKKHTHAHRSCVCLEPILLLWWLLLLL